MPGGAVAGTAAVVAAKKRSNKAQKQGPSFEPKRRPPGSPHGSERPRSPAGSERPARASTGGAADVEPQERSQRVSKRGRIGSVNSADTWRSTKRFEEIEVEQAAEEVQTGVRRLVYSRPFGSFITFTILVSAIQMGAQADIHDPGAQWLWDVFEHIFTAIFGLEMVLKMVADGLPYFSELWNITDFVIAWVSIIGAWIIPVYMLSTTSGAGSQGDGGADSLAVLRVFRLLRLFRILKIMKAVPELRMVIEGIAASLRAMFWVCMLLIIVIYTFSIYCVEIIGAPDAGFVGHNPSTNSILESKMMQNFNSFEYFGTIPRAMLSLFGITLLAEYDVVRPVWEVQAPSVVVFICLIFLTSFGIVNVIIGVIVERTTSSMAEMEKDEELRRQTESLRQIIKLGEQIWVTSDLDSNGVITREELGECAESPDIMHIFKLLDWPKGWTFEDLHMMLDADGGGDLTRDEFIDGMYRLIFGDDFQKACMNMLTAGQIKQMSFDIKGIVSEELLVIRTSMDEIRQSLAALARSGQFLPPAAHPAKPEAAAAQWPGTSDNSELSAEPKLPEAVLNALHGAVDAAWKLSATENARLSRHAAGGQGEHEVLSSMQMAVPFRSSLDSPDRSSRSRFGDGLRGLGADVGAATGDHRGVLVEQKAIRQMQPRGSRDESRSWCCSPSGGRPPHADADTTYVAFIMDECVPAAPGHVRMT